VAVTATNETDALYPGGPAGVIPMKVQNTNASSVLVSGVTVSVTGTSAGSACSASDFVVTQPSFGVTGNPSVTFPATLTPGETIYAGISTSGTGAGVALATTAPTSCQNVTVNLAEKAT